MAAYPLDDRGVVVTCTGCGQRNRLLYERLGDQVQCGQCKRELPGITAPIEIDSAAAFDRLIEHASVPVAVDYWAPWCGPCRMVAPELEKLAARADGRFVIAKVNTDALPDLSERFNIRSIPTFAVFVAGREASRAAGARPAAEIEAFISRVAAGSAASRAR
jgi:thioredoxin 2